MLDSSSQTLQGMPNEQGSLFHSQEGSTYLNFLFPLSSPHTHSFRFIEQPTYGHSTQMHSSMHTQTRYICPVKAHTLTFQLSLCYIHTRVHARTRAHTHHQYTCITEAHPRPCMQLLPKQTLLFPEARERKRTPYHPGQGCEAGAFKEILQGSKEKLFLHLV